MATAQRLRIGVADDDRGIRELIKGLCAQLDYDVVVECESGEELIAQRADHELDLVIIDQLMAGMTGLKTARIISNQSPPIPIVMISGCCDSEVIKQGVAHGVNGYLSKPISNKDQLKAAILFAIGQFRQHQTTKRQLNKSQEATIRTWAERILAEREGISPAEAHSKFLQLAEGKPPIEVARMIIDQAAHQSLPGKLVL